MWKSDFCMGYVEILKILFFTYNRGNQDLIVIVDNKKSKNCLVNSYRNTISEWAVVVRYENFFIPRVKKSSKISPWEKNLASRGPTALGRTKFFARGLIFEDFSTLGMKKFPYLKTGPFGNPIFSQTCGLAYSIFTNKLC